MGENRDQAEWIGVLERTQARLTKRLDETAHEMGMTQVQLASAKERADHNAIELIERNKRIAELETALEANIMERRNRPGGCCDWSCDLCAPLTGTPDTAGADEPLSASPILDDVLRSLEGAVTPPPTRTADTLEHWRFWAAMYDPHPEERCDSDNERRFRVNRYIQALKDRPPVDVVDGHLAWPPAWTEGDTTPGPVPDTAGAEHECNDYHPDGCHCPVKPAPTRTAELRAEALGEAVAIARSQCLDDADIARLGELDAVANSVGASNTRGGDDDGT